MASKAGGLVFRSLARVLVAGGLVLAGSTACGGAEGLAPAAKPASVDSARSAGSAAVAAPAKPAAAPAAAATTLPAAGGAKAAAAPEGTPAVVPGPAGSAITGAAADRPWDRMIVRNAALAVQVESVEDAIASVRNIARAGGGFVSASSTKIEKVKVGEVERERASASMTVQVRVDLFDAAIQSLRNLGKVESENGTSQDVTEEYVDLDSNLRSLRATESALMAMLEKAQSLPDVLTLQRELAGIRTQIERIEGRKRFLANRSEFSSIAVTLSPFPLAATPTPTPTPLPTPTWSPLGSAQVGWQASLRIVRAIVDLVVLTLAFSWWLVPFIGLGAYLLLRRSRRTGGAPAPTEG